MSQRFKLGDKVIINKEGLVRYHFGGYLEGHICIVEESHCYGQGLCVYNTSRCGWIHEGMGLYKYFDRVKQIYLGGE